MIHTESILSYQPIPVCNKPIEIDTICAFVCVQQIVYVSIKTILITRHLLNLVNLPYSYPHHPGIGEEYELY